MKKRKFKVKSEVWLYPGMAGWHFISVPKKQSDEISQKFGSMKRGWGSLPVTVTIGKTSWKTSIFPDRKQGTYLLPVKADVRKKERVIAGENISFSITLRV
ncbi:DUF1905 domain-containing protein [Candidatus Kaiserbacteria bacterium]|nr:DUF1905 domain-containing protein [Candidatus Kaiserbacteria bacterium]